MSDKQGFFRKWFSTDYNVKELPEERYNVNIDKLSPPFNGQKDESLYNEDANTIYYRNPKEYYLNPLSEGAAYRAHEFEHWRQNSQGAIPSFIKRKFEKKPKTIEEYQNDPKEKAPWARYYQYINDVINGGLSQK